MHIEFYITEKLLKRFWEKVLKTETCWLWTGFCDPYGKLGIGSTKSVQAHRISWVIHFDDIPKNKCVCHKCMNDNCVNPKHLFLANRSIASKNIDRIDYSKQKPKT